MKFRAIQTHTAKDSKGHFVSVQGIEARNGPFEMCKKRTKDIIGRDVNGDLWQFYYYQWQILLVQKDI